jgi:hypothetical protein
MSKDTPVIVIKEPFWPSLVKDTYTAGTLLATVGVGVWIESSALQWAAGIIWILWVLGRAARFGKDNTYSIPQARAKLDEIEANHPKEGE